MRYSDYYDDYNYDYNDLVENADDLYEDDIDESSSATDNSTIDNSIGYYNYYHDIVDELDD